MIDKLIDLRDSESTDWWNGISGAEKESIEIGINQADNDQMKSHSEARKIYEN